MTQLLHVSLCLTASWTWELIPEQACPFSHGACTLEGHSPVDQSPASCFAYCLCYLPVECPSQVGESEIVGVFLWDSWVIFKAWAGLGNSEWSRSWVLWLWAPSNLAISRLSQASDTAPSSCALPLQHLLLLKHTFLAVSLLVRAPSFPGIQFGTWLNIYLSGKQMEGFFKLNFYF